MRQRANGNGLGRIQRHFLAQRVADPDLQLPYPLPFLDWCGQWARIDDAGRDLVTACDRQEKLDRSFGLQGDGGLRAGENLRLAYNLTISEDCCPFEGAQPPFQQLARFLGAFLVVFQAAKGGDYPAPPLLCRAYDTESVLLAGAQHQPVTPHGQKRVAVQLPDLVPGEFLLAVVAVKVWIVVPDMAGEH